MAPALSKNVYFSYASCFVPLEYKYPRSEVFVQFTDVTRTQQMPIKYVLSEWMRPSFLIYKMGIIGPTLYTVARIT